MNRKIFDTYVETQLAPTLQPGDVVTRHRSAVASGSNLTDLVTKVRKNIQPGILMGEE
jgi:hypothetical protein